MYFKQVRFKKIPNNRLDIRLKPEANKQMYEYMQDWA